MLPDRYVDSYSKSSIDVSDNEEWVLRSHLIVDYISGMTDDFALETYQRLNGIRVS